MPCTITLSDRAELRSLQFEDIRRLVERELTLRRTEAERLSACHFLCVTVLKALFNRILVVLSVFHTY